MGGRKKRRKAREGKKGKRRRKERLKEGNGKKKMKWMSISKDRRKTDRRKGGRKERT